MGPIACPETSVFFLYSTICPSALYYILCNSGWERLVYRIQFLLMRLDMESSLHDSRWVMSRILFTSVSKLKSQTNWTLVNGLHGCSPPKDIYHNFPYLVSMSVTNCLCIWRTQRPIIYIFVLGSVSAVSLVDCTSQSVCISVGNPHSVRSWRHDFLTRSRTCLRTLLRINSIPCYRSVCSVTTVKPRTEVTRIF